MKAILEYSLPEEENEFETARNGIKYYGILCGVDEKLRGFLKYGHSFKTVEECCEALRQHIRDSCLDEGITLYK